MSDDDTKHPNNLNLARLIARLFAEAPVIDGTSAALQCHVLLRGAMQPIYGALSTTPEGTLRMMTPSKVQHHGEQEPRDIFLEQFFDVSDVVSLMVEREVKLERSLIVTPS